METSDNSDFSDFKKRFDAETSKAYVLQRKELYTPAIKAHVYSILGLPFRPNLFSIGHEKYDTRMSHCTVIRSGNGKKEFAEIAIRVATALGWSCSKMTSYHEEQLIGKNVMVNRELVTIEGYFRDDILVADDALAFFNDVNHDTSRAYCLQALDEYPRNQVAKRLVDQTRAQGLRYEPKCVILAFVQDMPILKRNITTGLLRKMPMLYIEAPIAEEETFFARATTLDKSDIEYLVRIAINAKDAKISWEFTEDCHRLLAHATQEIITQLAEHGAKGKDYASRMQFSIQNYLYKYTAILAAAYHYEQKSEKELTIGITPEMCRAAIDDFRHVLRAMYTHWERYVEDDPERLSPHETLILNTLHDRGHFSEETAFVGVPAFIDLLRMKRSAGASTYQNAIRHLDDKKMIGRCQIGKGEAGKVNSKIWLVVA